MTYLGFILFLVIRATTDRGTRINHYASIAQTICLILIVLDIFMFLLNT